MAEEQQDEWPGLEIPLDKVGADIMYTLNAREPKHYPEDIAEAAILFHIAGENWTVPSEGWEQTCLSLFAGDWGACKMQVETVYGAMERLKPKRVLGTECGHAHRCMVIEGPYWAGRKDGRPPVPYLHYTEWVAEALRTGKIKIDPAKKIREPVTLQDSCNYVRNYGLFESVDNHGCMRHQKKTQQTILEAKQRKTGTTVRVPVQLYNNDSHRYLEIPKSAVRLDVPDGIPIAKVVLAVQAALQSLIVN